MMKQRQRRVLVALIAALVVVSGAVYEHFQPSQMPAVQNANTLQQAPDGQQKASDVLKTLEVKGRAPKTDYKRSQFGSGWMSAGACDMRNVILKRDMTAVITRSETDCTVMQGALNDPYTAKVIQFVRGAETSDDVQIDHVVALSDAWQKGAQAMTADAREAFANDSLNLLAVDGDTNQKKGDGDAATWLPPNKEYRCRYVARQIAVKAKYSLWVTEAERDAMERVLQTCPDQVLPVTSQVL
jgi:hypothetical protein